MADVDLVARIVLIILSILMIIVFAKLKKEQRVGTQLFVILVIFWSVILISAIEPSILIQARDNTTLDSNAQLLLIISVIVILYLLFVQVGRLKITSGDLHTIVRKLAISNFKQNFSNTEKIEVLIVICAKNEENTIGKIIEEIKSMNMPFLYKILVVNDGSTDKTANISKAKGALLVDHVYNLGLGGAIKTGFIISKFLNPEIIINIDADGQHDPKYIPEIVSEIKNNGSDLVYASRFTKKSEYDSTTVKLVGNKFYTNLVKKIAKIPFTDVTSGYRGIKTSKIDSIFFVAESNFAIELAIRGAKNGLKITEIPVNAKIRKHGKSQFHRLERFVGYNTNALVQIFNVYFKKPKIVD